MKKNLIIFIIFGGIVLLFIYLTFSNYLWGFYNLLKWDYYRQVTSEARDPSDCNKILDQYIKESCYAGVGITKNDPSVCNLIKSFNKERNRCFTMIAISRKDESLCENVLPLNPIEISKDSVLDKKNINYHRDSCYNELAAVKRDRSLCKKIEGDYPPALWFCS